MVLHRASAMAATVSDSPFFALGGGLQYPHCLPTDANAWARLESSLFLRRRTMGGAAPEDEAGVSALAAELHCVVEVQVVVGRANSHKVDAVPAIAKGSAGAA